MCYSTKCRMRFKNSTHCFLVYINIFVPGLAIMGFGMISWILDFLHNRDGKKCIIK